MARRPPDYMLPILYSIESTVITLTKEFRKLSDKDIEIVYEQLKHYFQQLAKGKEQDEPSFSSESKEALCDEILNALDVREELGADTHLINNNDYRPSGVPIPSLAALYVDAFNILINSVRFWRKEKFTNYLKFIRENVILGDEE